MNNAHDNAYGSAAAPGAAVGACVVRHPGASPSTAGETTMTNALKQDVALIAAARGDKQGAALALIVGLASDVAFNGSHLQRLRTIRDGIREGRKAIASNTLPGFVLAAIDAIEAGWAEANARPGTGTVPERVARAGAWADAIGAGMSAAMATAADTRKAAADKRKADKAAATDKTGAAATDNATSSGKAGATDGDAAPVLDNIQAELMETRKQRDAALARVAELEAALAAARAGAVAPAVDNAPAVVAAPATSKRKAGTSGKRTSTVKAGAVGATVDNAPATDNAPADPLAADVADVWAAKDAADAAAGMAPIGAPERTIQAAAADVSAREGVTA